MHLPLADLIEISAAVGSVLGAAVGFERPARSDREMVDNVVTWAALGAVGGAGAALWVWTFWRLAGVD